MNALLSMGVIAIFVSHQDHSESKDVLKILKEKIYFSEPVKGGDCEQSFTRINNLRKHKIDCKTSDYMSSYFKSESCQSVFRRKQIGRDIREKLLMLIRFGGMLVKCVEGARR